MKIILICFMLISTAASCVMQRPQYVPEYTQVRTVNFFVDSFPRDAIIKLDSKVIGRIPNSIQFDYQYQERGYSKDESAFHNLQVVKEGYEEYNINFSIKDKEYKNIPSPIRLNQLLDESVSVTGAGSLLSRLTIGGAFESVLDLSPDKKWLLIQAKDDDNRKVLQKLSLKNSNKIILSPLTSDNIDATWSADMRSYVFVTNRLGRYTLAKSLGIKGEAGARFITEPSFGDIRNPDLNNKNEIAFSVSRGSNVALAVSDLDGTSIRMFSSGRQPAWSPNGKIIAFVRQVGGYSHLFSMTPSEGGNLMQLSDVNVNDRFPSWSPDGKHIAFISDRVYGNRHIFIMNKNGGAVTQITEGSYNVSSLDWGEDGYIYFSANAGGNQDIWKLKSNL